MKIGPRKPSFKKRVSSRNTGKFIRIKNKSTNPLYGKKRMGWFTNPNKAAYNKIYNLTTFDSLDFSDLNDFWSIVPFIIIILPLSIFMLLNSSGIIWFISLLFLFISGFSALILAGFVVLLIAFHPVISAIFLFILGGISYLIFNLLNDGKSFIPTYPFIVVYLLGILTRVVLIIIDNNVNRGSINQTEITEISLDKTKEDLYADGLFKKFEEESANK
ncbi:hypothetical protein ACQV2R_05130 [Facklamia sp. P12937]|uniref:hypothetical protein n=1 Tax=Facklamia sp. P12937 TaxID=3421949 RepID=UPI003D17CE26